MCYNNYVYPVEHSYAHMLNRSASACLCMHSCEHSRKGINLRLNDNV